MNLNDLTLQELWILFPITFVDYDIKFDRQFLIEKERLELLLGNYIKRISHIGSTAIKNIKTKPIVDILIETINQEQFQVVKDILLKNGYIMMNEGFNKISFNKGYTMNGYAENVFHIHIKKFGDCDELYFRDYLNDNYEIAKKYEKLKEELYNKYKPDRDLYTLGKSDFVKEIIELAKIDYKDRY